MKKIKLVPILFILLLTPLLAYSIQEVLVLKIDVQREGKIEFVDYYIDYGSESFELSDKETDYRLEVISKENSILYKKHFQPVFEVHLDILPGQTPKEGIISIDKTSLVLKVPFYDNTKSVKFYHKGVLVLEKEITFCNNNNLCESKIRENFLTCPSDCKSGSSDNYCDGILDGKCDQDCVNQDRSDKDIDCTCDNKICDVRENARTCPTDCKSSLWQRIINFIKNLLK